MPVIERSFHGPADRRSALDRAHRGDIEGAFGIIPSHDTAPRHSLRRHLTAFAAIFGPGLIVLVAGNDAGGLFVYAQAGQEHGAGVFWALLILAPVLFINQEMAARLGAVTGAGHARLIFERFGRLWGAFALSDLLVLNLLIVVTDFIGVTLALGRLGIGRNVAVPAAAAFLLVLTIRGGFRRWERFMFAMVAIDILLIPLLLLVHGTVGSAGGALSIAGGSDGAFFAVALVGATAAPWQLFLQQSIVVDKRVTARWLAYARVDTAAGTIAMVLGAVAVLAICAAALHGTLGGETFSDPGAVSRGLLHTSGVVAATIFTVVLLNVSLLGAGAVALSSAYAVGDVSGLRHSLHRGWRDAPAFYATFTAVIVVAAVLALLPALPIDLITDSAQVLAGILLPSACVLLLLLSNDAALLGPRTNPRWLNALGALEVGGLVLLSAFLAIGSAPRVLDERLLVFVLIGAGMPFLATWAALLVVEAHRHRRIGPRDWWEHHTWTMPAIETLSPPSLTRGRALGLVLLRAYLLVAVAFTIVRVLGVGGYL